MDDSVSLLNSTIQLQRQREIPLPGGTQYFLFINISARIWFETIAHKVASSEERSETKHFRSLGFQLNTEEIPENNPLMLIYPKSHPRQPMDVRFLQMSMCRHRIPLEVEACPSAVTSTQISHYVPWLLYFVLCHVNTHFQ